MARQTAVAHPLENPEEPEIEPPSSFAAAAPPNAALHPQLRLCVDGIAEVKILAPRSNLAPDQVDDNCVVRNTSLPISSPSHIPILLDCRFPSVRGDKHILYLDSQIRETLEVTCYRCLHVFGSYVAPRRNQFSVGKPVRGSNAKIVL